MVSKHQIDEHGPMRVKEEDLDKKLDNHYARLDPPKAEQ